MVAATVDMTSSTATFGPSSAPAVFFATARASVQYALDLIRRHAAIDHRLLEFDLVAVLHDLANTRHNRANN